MLFTLTLTAMVALVGATPVLFLLGRRWRLASPSVSVAIAVPFAVAAGEVAARLFRLPSDLVLIAEVVLFLVVLATILSRRAWNAVGQLFFASLVTMSGAYLLVAARATFAGGLSALGLAASVVLLVFEVFAVTISLTFAFESIDVVCRCSWDRPPPVHDQAYRPFVSLHVPAYNEPSDMLIETIQSLEALDYPNFEIVVIDNNTADDDVWRPVETYCAGRPRVTFVHVAPWPGFKSGALNLVLRDYTHPDAEIVGVVDADYLVRSDYLDRLVGYFADPQLAFLQTPQDYRDYQGDTYLTACYDGYRYFFETAMPSRNERNSIIFGGTMGLIRRSALEELGGWDEWCITEDAEASLRMLRNGHRGLYVNETYGQGIMPLTFTSLKKQRFRWCFGGVQILRKHWRSLLPWDRSPDNHLSVPQRLDYLLGGLQWFGDFAGLVFTAILIVSGVLLVTTGHVALRALSGALLLVPGVLIGTGLLRAVWALRARTHITRRRAVLAFATWLGLSWTTALACIRGVFRSEGVFLRTPKWKSGGHLIEALRETRHETGIAAVLAGLAISVGVARGRWLVVALLGWQTAVFACSPFMAWLNQRTELSARLARRQRSEERRDRATALAPVAVRTGAGAVLALGVTAVVLFGGNLPGHQNNAFTRPVPGQGDRGPLGNLGVAPSLRSAPAIVTPGGKGSTPKPGATTATTGPAGSPSGGAAPGAPPATTTVTAAAPSGTPIATVAQTPTTIGTSPTSTTPAPPTTSPPTSRTPPTSSSPPTSASPPTSRTTPTTRAHP
ncbi:MAG: hypothetical protein NVS3B21_23630 [Acidimicrobiales bacterium]